MDLSYPPSAEAFRSRVRDFITANVPADFAGIGALDQTRRREFIREWRKTLADNGLLAVLWPKRYGGAGLTPLHQVVLAEEFARAGVPAGTENDMFGIQLLGNTLVVCGTEDQKNWFLPRILSGDDRWCQGFSEPDAGSDLASLRTRAVLDGDEWVINGSKIWTSVGHLANWIFALCRTDMDAPKHRGISFLLVPMDQPGVEVRPIKNIVGQSMFNEVFFTDARTAADNVVGDVNAGWSVAMTLLGFERGTSVTTDAIRFQAEIDRLFELAKERGKTNDPHIREQLAWCYGRVEIMRCRGYQALTRFLHGEYPGPEAAMTKILWSEFFQRETELAMEILETDVLTLSGTGTNGALATADVGTPNCSLAWVESALAARAATIYAGSSQVQRNIIGEKLLGLPKEPRLGPC
ncbi:acyl-CoA dehydrogenase [Mycobacterium intracellulare subsp. chimaera]|uniref:acyl-CoA dehydrogenase family protein n=1 Tax=Mycobacterium intracellulare TaxID=1767 RepID=UPI0008596AC2|nr:acyl-CoA dehydrogenase family protein [Mycobacterium intracellulare]AOS90817.1 acyl-CoA dehydrogenase [Mycobacterium intracellulare subsp. chimaera]PBA28984.1 acyl-CoA dehydrogenase [Mycobacterium intracellulare]